MPKGNKPLYDLTVVKNMIREGSYTVTKRVLGHLGNHGYVVDEVVEDVFESISESDFLNRFSLRKSRVLSLMSIDMLIAMEKNGMSSSSSREAA